MNRRNVLAALAAGAVLPYCAARAQNEQMIGDRMQKWAYSTEGYDRTVHRIDGIETVVYAIGQGEPLVYFHGGGTFHGFEWSRALANDFRVYHPIHPNFGESGDAPFDQMGDYVQHYEMLFPALGLDTFHLAGASMGGHMAWIEPSWPTSPTPAWQALRDREQRAAFASREDADATDRALRQGLKGFDRPTLLLWGEKDKVVPPSFVQEWQEVLPDAEVAMIPNGGHLLFDEFPEAVEALRDFLKE